MSGSLQRRFGSITADQVARLDRAALELGVEMVQLMEVAGFQVARLAWQRLRGRPGQVHVVAGRGHNGGDGLVAARHLAAWGCSVSAAVLADAGALDELMSCQVTAARGADVAVELCSRADAALRGVSGADLVVDALLGTGLRQPPRALHAEVIESLNGHAVLSVDIPRGLDASSGEAPGAVVRATATCTLTAMKRGMWIDAARRFTGEVVVADIGMPRRAWEMCAIDQPTAVGGGRLLRVPATEQGRRDREGDRPG